MGSLVCARTFLGRSLFRSYKRPVLKCRTLTKHSEAGFVLSPIEKKVIPSYEEVKEELGSFSNKAYNFTTPALLLVLSGPSGVGKDAVIREFTKQYNNDKKMDRKLITNVSVTTRARRENEKDGVDYHFVSKETFEQWIYDGEFIEYSEVYGDYKGVLEKPLKKALNDGSDFMLRLDTKGVETMKSLYPDCVSVFLMPNSIEQLIEQLVNRQTESLEELRFRIKSVKDEIEYMKTKNTFDYVLKNPKDDLPETASKLLDVLNVERMKRSRLFPLEEEKSS